MSKRVLVVCGSLGKPSRTETLLRIVEAGCQLEGLKPAWYDLAEHDLGLANPGYHRQPERHPNAEVRALVEQANDSAAFVLGTPVYHNSYSGVLKNFLDHLAVAQFEGKPVGLICHGGTLRSVQPCDHLRVVVRGLHGIATVNQVVSADRDFVGADGGFKIVNRALFDRVAVFVKELSFFIERLRPAPVERRDALWTPEEGTSDEENGTRVLG